MDERHFRLEPGSPYLKQRDPVTRNVLQVGDEVVECSKGHHVYLQSSWTFLGGKCTLCHDRGSEKPAPQPPVPVRPRSTGLPFTLGWLIAIAVILVLAIVGIAAIVNQLPAPPAAQATQIVVLSGSPEVVVITATPEASGSKGDGSSTGDGGSSSGSPGTDPSNLTGGNCDGAIGPSFKIGDRFVVPFGDGPSNLFRSPNRVPKVATIYEGDQGTILDGPQCVAGQEGDLYAWYVELDTGAKGWVSEGYTHSKVPWIEPVD